MRHLEHHIGLWTGPNGFRLRPGDPLFSAPLSATVSRAVNGELAQIAYSWVHPADGEQHGVLVFGQGDEPGAIAAFWGDSWHQSPEPRNLTGSVEGSVVTVGYAYSGDWRWEIIIDAASPDVLTMTMINVIPESAVTGEKSAGAYAAMTAELRRAQ